MPDIDELDVVEIQVGVSREAHVRRVSENPSHIRKWYGIGEQ